MTPRSVNVKGFGKLSLGLFLASTLLPEQGSITVGALTGRRGVV